VPSHVPAAVAGEAAAQKPRLHSLKAAVKRKGSGLKQTTLCFAKKPKEGEAAQPQPPAAHPRDRWQPETIVVD
jgi:hypothetical protein